MVIMRTLFTAILMLVCSGAFAGPVYKKLCEVNKYWQEQKDVNPDKLASASSRSETEWIRLHLSLVEQTLRNRSVAHLNKRQLENRMNALDRLHEYWQAGRFPQNEDYAYRTPIFIDKYDNFCAVGYLVKATGYESVSRKISAETNLAYVHDMNYPELNEWASTYGFTTDELAWIQPGYAVIPKNEAKTVGKGTSGEVKELYVNTQGDKLYVGGAFGYVDSTIKADNIAYVTEQGGVYTWHTMGKGVTGEVRAITEYDGKIFIAGKISQSGDSVINNVAYWDGSKWQTAGCIYGEVNDLVVFKGELYAVGKFDVCAALADVNFAKWNGSIWQQVHGLSGEVMTMEVAGDDLLIGGDFEYNGNRENVIKWNATDEFTTYNTNIPYRVNDFQLFGGKMYAVCSNSTTGRVDLMYTLSASDWDTVGQFNNFYFIAQSFNTLCAAGDRLMLGGDFYFSPMYGYSAANCVDASGGSSLDSGKWFNTDGIVNKLVVFKDHVFAGGAFNKGLAYENERTLSVPQTPAKPTFELYPNPVTSASTLVVNTGLIGSTFTLRDMTGKLLFTDKIRQANQQITIPALSTGMYMAEVWDMQGSRQVSKLLVQ